MTFTSRGIAFSAAGLTSAGAPSVVHTRSFSGPCRIGSWSFQVRYDAATGIIRSMNGARCGVVLWSNPCTVTRMPNSAGADCTHVIEMEDGCWIRFDVDAEGRVAKAWGRSSTGYYVVESEDDVADYY